MIYQLGSDRVVLGANTYVAPGAHVMGKVILADDASVWFNAVLRGDCDLITVGQGSNVQDGSILHTDYGYPLEIGKGVTIGHKVMLHGCTIEDRVLVGMGAIVLDGVIIKEEVMIGAGSLVPPNKVLESGYLYVGSPVKQARPLNDKERAFLQKSADNYVQNKNDYLDSVLPA